MDDAVATLAKLPNLVSDEASRASLVEHWRTAHEALPRVSLTLEQFVRAWDRQLARPTSLVNALAAVYFDDLVLAIACGEGDPAALELLDRRYLSQIGSYLGKHGGTASFADEVRQRVRLRLLVAEPGGTPKIAGYTGSGPLGAWLRVITIRSARDLHRAAHPTSPLTDAIAVASPKPDPELDYLKLRHGAEFRAALAEVLGSLQPRQRNLLKLYFLDGLTVEIIGGMFGVNRSTVTRWLADIRERIRDETYRVLRARLGVGDSELEHLWGIVESRMDLSLRGLLVTKR
jgi:RNA polymerase sigma-70 factor (ECF subfamily)